MPSDVARSAIFTCRAKSAPRRQLKRAILFSAQEDLVVRYSGTELRADDDELVWLELVNRCREYPLGRPVSFSLYEFLGSLGWPRTGAYYEKLRDCFTRLQACAIQFHAKREDVLLSVSFINHFEIDRESTRGARCRLSVSPEIVALYERQRYNLSDRARYRDLSPIARRLHDYLGCHARPYPVLLTTLREVCASECKETRKWKQQVSRACAELRDAGLIAEAEIRDGRIHCKR
jgi:hypothetical protein